MWNVYINRVLFSVLAMQLLMIFSEFDLPMALTFSHRTHPLEMVRHPSCYSARSYPYRIQDLDGIHRRGQLYVLPPYSR